MMRRSCRCTTVLGADGDPFVEGPRPVVGAATVWPALIARGRHGQAGHQAGGAAVAGDKSISQRGCPAALAPVEAVSRHGDGAMCARPPLPCARRGDLETTPPRTDDTCYASRRRGPMAHPARRWVDAESGTSLRLTPAGRRSAMTAVPRRCVVAPPPVARISSLRRWARPHVDATISFPPLTWSGNPLQGDYETPVPREVKWRSCACCGRGSDDVRERVATPPQGGRLRHVAGGSSVRVRTGFAGTMEMQGPRSAIDQRAGGRRGGGLPGSSRAHPSGRRLTCAMSRQPDATCVIALLRSMGADIDERLTGRRRPDVALRSPTDRGLLRLLATTGRRVARSMRSGGRSASHPRPRHDDDPRAPDEPAQGIDRTPGSLPGWRRGRRVEVARPHDHGATSLKGRSPTASTTTAGDDVAVSGLVAATDDCRAAVFGSHLLSSFFADLEGVRA